MATNNNGNGNGPVFDQVQTVKLEKPIAGITALKIKHLIPKEGSNSPVSHYITPVVTGEFGETELPRSFQFMARVRPPQVQDENTKEWANDPSFPEKLRTPETLRAISDAVVKALATGQEQKKEG